MSKLVVVVEAIGSDIQARAWWQEGEVRSPCDNPALVAAALEVAQRAVMQSVRFEGPRVMPVLVGPNGR